MPVLQAELALQAVINGVPGVRVLDYAAVVAVCVPYGIAKLIRSGCPGCAGSRAWGQARRNKVAKTVAGQCQDIWVAIDLLEITYTVIAHIANFGGHLVSDLSLNA